MEPTFMTELRINKVRHLENITIPLSKTERKHLILTGKNGSGKTSVLEFLAEFLNSVLPQISCQEDVDFWLTLMTKCSETAERVPKKGVGSRNISKIADLYNRKLFILNSDVFAAFAEFSSLYETSVKYDEGTFILAYYSDHRNFDVDVSKNIEKIELQKVYSLADHPGRDFVKYLVNLKTRQAFAQTQDKPQFAQEIQCWFDSFEAVLRDLYEESSLRLDFDINSFEFNILMDGREPFDFNTMSRGYSAVFDIICDLMMRMGGSDYSKEGLVLIDEIETHLHVDLQKKIMPALTKLFPNIQFVITTHSPFVLNSLDNAVVYDLEKHILVENGLTNLPYQGIVEGYFDSDTLSTELREKFDRYKVLVAKADPSDNDYAEMSELELYLDEVPDYLALDFATEYARLKLEANS